MAQQSFQSHGRLDPVYHFFIAPLATFLVISGIWGLYKAPNGLHLFQLILSVLILVIAATTRVYALKNQDRLIRLEEKIRLHRLMPNEPTAIESLNCDQLIGLRFASDAEVADLARRTIRENLTRKQIKAAITNWRPDHQRI